VQNYMQGDPSIRPHQRVMIQTSGQYQRVLPADDMPESIKRPKKIRVTD
jgi:outer membrane lipoprotein SlyB